VQPENEAHHLPQFHELVPEMAREVSLRLLFAVAPITDDTPTRRHADPLTPVVPFYPGQLPERGGVPTRDGRQRLCGGAYLGGKDGGGGVRDRAGCEAYDEVSGLARKSSRGSPTSACRAVSTRESSCQINQPWSQLFCVQRGQCG
jgi:hypothetical protein